MRWAKSSLFVLCISIANFVEAAVPDSLSGSFVDGLSLAASFGSTIVRDDSTTVTEAISDAPVLSVSASGAPLADNTLFTVILLEISGSTDPSSEAVLRYAGSNLRAPSTSGGELGGGATGFAYQPPSGNAQLVFLAFVQPDGDFNFDDISDAATFSVSNFLRTNQFEAAVTGFGFSVNSGSNSSTTGSTTSFSSTETNTPSNSTTTTSSKTTQPPPPPPPLVTSTYTLSQDGSAITIVTVVPGGPDATSLNPSPTTEDPSLITNDPNTGSQNVVSKSALALLAFSAFFVAFI